jgi:HAD superfamily hydrolase (TIGR01459 family)
VVFVTNTSRAAAAVIETLVVRMGIDRALFHDVVSSGDVTRDALAARDPAVFAGLPSSPRCFHHGDPSFVPWLFELPFVFTDDLADADFIVASGAPHDDAGLGSARVLLGPAAARGVPLVCTNPDAVIPNDAGDTLGPGAVARVYADLGGATFLYGKPFAPIYAEARRRLGIAPGRPGRPGRRLVAIGDLVETDIRGARTAGIPSVLVTRGRAIAPPSDAAPDETIDRFVW